MNRKGKLPVILLIVIIIVSLLSAAGGFYLLQQEKRKSTELQEQLDNVRTSEKVAKKQLEEWQSKYTALDMRLTEANTQAENLKNELLLEKSAKQESLAKIEQLKSDRDQQKQLMADLEKKLGIAQRETENMQVQLKDLSSKKQELETKIKQLETENEGVELGKIVVSPETAINQGVATGAAKLTAPVVSSVNEGKVLVVNNDHDFLVFNLGSKNGIRMGDVFSVFHNNKNIGEVKVEKVQDNMSAAGFVSSNIKGKAAEGDRVLFKGK